MSTLKVLDADRQPQYLSMIGTGTELDPFRPRQDVFIQDQTTPQLSLFLGQELDSTATLRSPVAADDETVALTVPLAVPVAGNFLCFKEGDLFTQMEIHTVTPVGGNDYDVTVAIPMDHIYTTGASICLQNVDMNVNGSVTPVEFFVSPFGAAAGTQWDITRMLVSMTHSASGDDGKFGGIAALTTGTYFRVEDGTNYNLFNAKENADFAAEGYDITYPIRSGGGGVYGTRSRITFNGPDKRGVVFRLSADSSDKFLACVRDDLTGLASFRVKVQGQVVD